MFILKCFLPFSSYLLPKQKLTTQPPPPRFKQFNIQVQYIYIINTIQTQLDFT